MNASIFAAMASARAVMDADTPVDLRPGGLGLSVMRLITGALSRLPVI
jgi:hypothetical protein